MTKKELEDIEVSFLVNGYKKWTQATTNIHTSHEWMKHDEHDDYIISFRVWDFEKYRKGEGYSIDVCIVDSIDNIRTDLILTINSNIDIPKMEHIANAYHRFLKENL